MPKSLNRDKIIFLILTILSLASFIFPFRKEWYEDYDLNPDVEPDVEILTGIDLFPLMLSVVVMVGIALLVLFSKRKGFKVLAIVLAILYLLLIILMYFALTFTLSLFGPAPEVIAGTGYYLLAFFSLLFTIQVILTVRKSWNAKLVKVVNLDLLDDL